MDTHHQLKLGGRPRCRRVRELARVGASTDTE